MKYSSVITDHFESPRNGGALPDATAVGEATNPVCLDRLRLYLKQSAAGGPIEAASFQAEGCVPALAVGSFLTEYVLGKTPEELLALDAASLEQLVGGLPPAKKHAAHLGTAALKDAVAKRLFPKKGAENA